MNSNHNTTPKGVVVADLFASLVVFMVALPLCIAIAEASGLPPEAGVVTGVVGGILVGLISGGPLQVSGPAAGLIVLVQDLLNKSGLQTYALALLLAGGIQVVLGLLKLGHWFRAVSPAVVLGMLAGIGAIILGKQTHVLFDRPAPESVAGAYAAIPATLYAAIHDPASIHAGVVGLMAVIVMAFWKSSIPKPVKIIPAAVVAVVAATLVAEISGWSVRKVEIGSLSAFFTEGRIVQPGTFGQLSNPAVWVAALTMALIASAESLLCAAAVDAKQTGPRTKYNKELVAQGVGNAICGAVGALPMTGVIVRSATNIDAGAKSRLSAILHGVWLLMFVALLPSVLHRIPVAALAGVLVVTGWKLLELPQLAKLWRIGKAEVAIYLATACGIVFTNLLTGVVIGLVLSAGRLLWQFSHLKIVRNDDPGKNRVHLYLEGAGTFLRLPVIAAELDAVPPGMHLHVHLDRLHFVDHAVLELLTSFQKTYEAKQGRFYIDWENLKARFHTLKNGNEFQIALKTPTEHEIELDAMRKITSTGPMPEN
ncbi:MAG TPA: SulP family inorganic anion transporter [Fimbriiglobus sp.]|jgi:MFS superfamily sulfate permease-like transporter